MNQVQRRWMYLEPFSLSFYTHTHTHTHESLFSQVYKIEDFLAKWTKASEGANTANDPVALILLQASVLLLKLALAVWLA